MQFVLANGSMRGMGKAAFTPGSSPTRAQMCQIVYNMAGAPHPSGEAEFSDVAQRAWYASLVVWCVENKIVSAKGTSFTPEHLLTRQEVAEFYIGMPFCWGRMSLAAVLRASPTRIRSARDRRMP